jgi:hypothetical protein
MYFHVMFDQRAAAVAIDACERVRSVLAGFADSHAYAADLARPDWSGPHRESFERSFAAIQDELAREAASLARLAGAIEEASVAAAAVARADGPR